MNQNLPFGKSFFFLRKQVRRHVGISHFVLLTFFSSMITTGFSQNGKTLKLWYKRPAGTTWENALPVGNGRLGAMVYGNVEKETIQLNEHTVWTGSPNRNEVEETPEPLLSQRATVTAPALKETWLYDIPTTAGATVRLVAQ